MNAADPALAAPSENGASILSLRGVGRVYGDSRVGVVGLVDFSLDVEAGDFVAVVGPSGSGKSTLLNILGCLDRPTSGQYVLAGHAVQDLDDDGLAAMRATLIGFVFQSYNLLPRTAALENVATPLAYRGIGRRERLARARDARLRLGLGDRLDHEPSRLSGGEQQRVAIARALVGRPAVVLADEPTGNLDSRSGAEVLSVLEELNREGSTIVMITHDRDVAARAGRQVGLRDGRRVS